MKGFTLIEIIIVIAIFVSIVGVGAFVGIDFYQGSSLESERADLVTVLRKARSRALSNINETAHGVYLGGGQYMIFQGSSYAARNSQFDQIVKKPSGVSLSGLNEAVFYPLRGDTSASGTIILTNAAGKTESIEINYEGRIN